MDTATERCGYNCPWPFQLVVAASLCRGVLFQMDTATERRGYNCPWPFQLVVAASLCRGVLFHGHNDRAPWLQLPVALQLVVAASLCRGADLRSCPIKELASIHVDRRDSHGSFRISIHYIL